ncbi:MAG TPA: XkdX family protein [Candidatus Acidoferrum sp.]|nr:XkdX family protein [Candidatus Acidoferrum sp.]
MTTKELAKKNYDRGLWSTEMLAALVRKATVSFAPADYEELTGEAYAE